ncbi:MAG: methyl-accepting chemotaxis protein [Phycisphaerales bacterium]|nr:methyl-accepting chemotaxis protein [Phycisphaerales bacterium]
MSTSSFLNTLSGRMLLFGVVPTVLVIAAIVTMSAIDGYRDLRNVEESLLSLSARDAAAQLNGRNERWNMLATTMAMAQSHGLFGARKDSTDFARSVASDTPGIVGAYVVYEPDADGQDAAALKSAELPRDSMDSAGRFVPYWVKSAGAAVLHQRTGMETMESYQGPKNAFARAGRPAAYITEPMVRNGVMVVTHAHPIVIEGKFAGNAGVDRDLATIAGVADNIKSRLGADVFIFSGTDRFIATTLGEKAGGDAERLVMQEVAKTPYGALAEQWRSNMSAGRVFEAVDPVLKEPCLYATSTTEAGAWNIVVRRTRADVLRLANAAMKRNVILGSIGLVVVGGLMFFVTRSVSLRVRAAAETADRIARGDLTRPVAAVSSRDEAGQLIRSMSTMDGNLNSLIGSVKQVSIRLNSTATEIGATSKQQEASASTFGAASSQIAAAVKEISATGKDLVRTMEAVSENAAETAQLAGAGRAGLQGMESVMQELDRATASIAEKLGTINERSQKITTVITTITKVADQTNILSINAAIEAEKAGEFGAGFLVIAREIRRLADQTASATLDIEQMVQQMQASVSSGVMEMDRFSDQVRRGVRDVVSAGLQLGEIIDRVNRSTESFKQVNESMQAQSEGAQQISEAMTSLSANAHQTMQSVQEFGRASADLQSTIAVLRQAVAQFKLKE